MASKNSHDLKAIIKRLERLEKAIFAEGPGQIKPKKTGNFRGLKGGVQLLISQKYFNVKRTATEVKPKLEEDGYLYSIAAIQTTLNRLSARKGPLVTFKEDGKKYYAQRR